MQSCPALILYRPCILSRRKRLADMKISMNTFEKRMVYAIILFLSYCGICAVGYIASGKVLNNVLGMTFGFVFIYCQQESYICRRSGL